MNPILVQELARKDSEDYVRLAKEIFVEEQAAQGMTPEEFETQVRSMLRWHFSPVRSLYRLAGCNWVVLVAEKDGRMAGGGMYSGRRRIFLSSLMVDPEYRRRGIAQALLVNGLQRLALQGYACATTKIPSSNEASLGNVNKQGFEVYNSYSLFERSSVESAEIEVDPEITLRRIKPSDRPVLTQLESQLTDPVVLYLNESSRPRYLPSLWSRLGQSGIWDRAVERKGKVIGFMYGRVIRGRTKGYLTPPLIAEGDMGLVPALLQAAFIWFRQQGTTVVQTELLDTRIQMAKCFEASGWQKVSSWVELVKWFDESVRVRVKAQ